MLRGVVPLITLRHGAVKVGIIEQWKALAMRGPDARRRSDYGGLGLVFAEAAKRLPIWKAHLKEWNMIESQQVLEWMAQGEARGEARGETNLLLRLLEKRHGSIPVDLVKVIRQTQDLSVLRAWFDLALDAPSLSDFRKQTGI